MATKKTPVGVRAAKIIAASGIITSLVGGGVLLYTQKKDVYATPKNISNTTSGVVKDTTLVNHIKTKPLKRSTSRTDQSNNYYLKINTTTGVTNIGTTINNEVKIFPSDSGHKHTIIDTLNRQHK